MWIFYILGFIINYKLLWNFQLNTKELLIVAIIGGIISFIVGLFSESKKIITAIISFAVEVMTIIIVLKLEELYIISLDNVVHQHHFFPLYRGLT